MKTYTLEQLLSKLIKRKYVENKAQIKIEIERDTIKTTRASLYRDDSVLLLMPVTEVYISIGDTITRKRLLTITDSGIDYVVTTASIEKNVYEMFGNKLNDVYSGYILTFVCRKLPEAFLRSFIYQEGFMSPDIYLTLMRYKNTIMNDATYSECIYWINKHKNYIIKQYGIKTEHADDEPPTADKLLADVLSIVTGFRVQLRLGSEGVVSGYYVIEAVK